MTQPMHAGEWPPYERVWVGNSKTKAIIALIHPTAVLIFGLLTWILGLMISAGSPAGFDILLSALAMSSAQASIGVFNEVFDRDLDGRAKPWRAIPAGMISLRMAICMGLACLGLGSLFTFFVSPVAIPFLVLGTGIGFVYSYKLKRTMLSWIPYVLAYPSLPVWVTISLGEFEPRILVIYLLAAPFAVAVHFINQLRDFDTDESMSIKGLVQHLGKPWSISLCLLLLGISPLPFLFEIVMGGQFAWLWVVLLISLFHWAITCLYLWKERHSPSPQVFRSLFRRLQISGPLMLIAWFWIFQHG